MNATLVGAHFRAMCLGRSETCIYGDVSRFRRVQPVIFAQQVMHLDEFPVPALEIYPPGRWSPRGIRD